MGNSHPLKIHLGKKELENLETTLRNYLKIMKKKLENFLKKKKLNHLYWILDI